MSALEQIAELLARLDASDLERIAAASGDPLTIEVVGDDPAAGDGSAAGPATFDTVHRAIAQLSWATSKRFASGDGRDFMQAWRMVNQVPVADARPVLRAHAEALLLGDDAPSDAAAVVESVVNGEQPRTSGA